jgi:hypothetical protein
LAYALMENARLLLRSYVRDNAVPQNERQPSKEYNQVVLQTVHKRVAWGGYRLAELLNSIWAEQ